MSLTKRAVELSNGKWVSVSEMKEALGIKPCQNPLRNMVTAKSITCEVIMDAKNNYVKYRAFYHKDKSNIELARMRKAAGVVRGIESFSILGGAANV